MFNRCYANASQVVALANNLGILAGSIDKLVHGKDHLSPEEITEVQVSAATFCRMSQAFAVDGGRTMCAAQVGVRHLWLGLSCLKETDKRPLLDLPISRSSLFGPDMQALVDRMEYATRTSAQLAPHLRADRTCRPAPRHWPYSDRAADAARRQPSEYAPPRPPACSSERIRRPSDQSRQQPGGQDRDPNVRFQGGRRGGGARRQ